MAPVPTIAIFMRALSSDELGARAQHRRVQPLLEHVSDPSGDARQREQRAAGAARQADRLQQDDQGNLVAGIKLELLARVVEESEHVLQALPAGHGARELKHVARAGIAFGIERMCEPGNGETLARELAHPKQPTSAWIAWRPSSSVVPS